MTHLSCIDHVDKLRTLIRDDLRELGIKVPKPKKSKRAKLQQDVGNKSVIFGNYLAQVHCVYDVESSCYVAKFLKDAADIILANIESEGVFRKSGAVSRQKEIKQQLENGKGFVGANVHDVTALVKQFFRELPEPLFTSMYHDTFIRCYQLDNQEVAKKAILLLCLMLPGEHVNTLRFIMLLLSKIANQSDKNKMDSTNLSVVLAPNLMHVNSKSETMKSCEEKLLQVQTSVVELLIDSAQFIGMVDEDLVKKTKLMSEVFSTDDELDGSEDNLEDTKEAKRKEKKRKRSGSFQGFINQIGQSITKWRRSTDGKTNTSNLSQGSNFSIASQDRCGEASSADDEYTQNVALPQYAMSTITPVVRRSKSTVTGSHGAFSASKKKAILRNLPQHATLASTPFTPASTVKKMDINSVKRRAGKDTPSIPPRPYQGTPRHSMKTPRKKLTLFSPASSMKKKRYSSTTNLSIPSPGKKTSKGKGIFRRLSGSKGDMAFTGPGSLPASTQSHQIGQRLASPTTTPNGSLLDVSDKFSNQTITDESPIAAIMQTSSYSASVCEHSVMSATDERASLNDGFIAPDKDDVEMSFMMSEPDISRLGVDGEYVSFDSIPRQTVSDTTVNILDKSRAHNRSYSADGTLDGSLKKSSLRRGQPNSVKAGLCHGSEKEVQKLRRSFGLDKSDIGYPIPVSVPNMSGSELIVLDQSITSFDSGNVPSETVSCASLDIVNSIQTGSPDSGSQTCSVNKRDVEPMETASESCNLSEKDIEKGQSLLPGNTNISKAEISDNCLNLKAIESKENGAVAIEGDKKKLKDQKYESVDSLFSEASTCSPLSSVQREMTRSISADSGKGSICDESLTDPSNATVLESEAFITVKETVTKEISNCLKMSNVEISKSGEPDREANISDAVDKSETEMTEQALEEGQKPTLPQKSRSTQDLQQEVRTPTVARSKSLLSNTVTRKHNGKPNLQISAETHKLLARAGYISEQKTEKPKEQEDFTFAGNVEFPLIKQAEIVNPRRESLIALQKNKAGFVKSNVRQIERISEEIEDIVEKHASPYRFPNSTTRKRGMSPMKIPACLSKNDSVFTPNAEDKLSFGTAKLPISTQLIKPSDAVAQMGNDLNASLNKSSSLKRKPSIYYAKRETESSVGMNFKPTLNRKNNLDNSNIINEYESPESFCKGADKSDTSNDCANNQNGPDNTQPKVVLNGHNIELNASLVETINMVCTPMSEKLVQSDDRIPKSNKENTLKSRKMPDLKQPITTPLTVDNITLRTGSGKTPVEVLKTSKSPRSPVKPLKRLGSPASPRCRIGGSPKMLKNRRQLLTAAPCHSEDEINNL